MESSVPLCIKLEATANMISLDVLIINSFIYLAQIQMEMSKQQVVGLCHLTIP